MVGGGEDLIFWCVFFQILLISLIFIYFKKDVIIIKDILEKKSNKFPKPISNKKNGNTNFGRDVCSSSLIFPGLQFPIFPRDNLHWIMNILAFHQNTHHTRVITFFLIWSVHLKNIKTARAEENFRRHFAAPL